MAEIADLERTLAEAKAYLLALDDSLKLVSRTGGGAEASEPVLRPGTALAKARDFLQKVGEAQHVNKILEGIGDEVNKGNRVSMSGSLSNYARKGLIFTRPAPNTFGLKEFENGGKGGEPPADFGLVEKEKGEGEDPAT